ncbi:hypothetical protein NADFUDRAFT_83869, partial [Nadsonia fulvescens var. elongata DSM 6958]
MFHVEDLGRGKSLLSNFISNASLYDGSQGRKRIAHRAPQADSAARQRAIQKRLAELDRENYADMVKIDTPKLDLVPLKKLNTTRGMSSGVKRILASKKMLSNFLDEDEEGAEKFFSVSTGPSNYPAKKLCSICGYWGKFTCVRCGALYCGLN